MALGRIEVNGFGALLSLEPKWEVYVICALKRKEKEKRRDKREKREEKREERDA